jgi:elongator complex protein 1
MKMFILNIPANQGHSLMRNLSLFRKRLITGISGAVYLVEDYDHFYVFKEGPLDSLARVNKQTQAMTELVVVCEGPLESSTVVGAHIHPSERTLLVALASGEICFYHIDDEAAVGKVLGSFPSGILAMATSPDDELVALINGGLQVIIMQRSSLSVLCEISLATAVGSFTAENVTVGWGKKETQFHGSVGKQAALTKVTVHEEITPGDDRGVRLSWRQDAAHLAVSFVTEQDCTPFRQICIMNRDGQVSAVKEPTAELGSTLAWRRDGGLIAASRKCGEETKLVFFERNGLQHGEFSLKGDVEALICGLQGIIIGTTSFQFPLLMVSYRLYFGTQGRPCL